MSIELHKPPTSEREKEPVHLYRRVCLMDGRCRCTVALPGGGDAPIILRNLLLILPLLFVVLVDSDDLRGSAEEGR